MPHRIYSLLGRAGISARGGTLNGYTPSLTGRTLYDPNSIVQSATAGTPTGMLIKLQNPGASRNLPNTGAVWSSTAGLVDVVGNTISSFDPMKYLGAIHVQERAIPATTPCLFMIGYGWADNADPTLATAGLLFGIEYAASNQRRTFQAKCTALNTWAVTSGTTGQSNCAGTEGRWTNKSALGLTDFSGLPLDSSGNILTAIGSNTNRTTVTLNLTTFTHSYVFVGWQATGGNSGDEIRFDCHSWLCPLTGRG